MGRWIMSDGSVIEVPGVKDAQEAVPALQAKYAGNAPDAEWDPLEEGALESPIFPGAPSVREYEIERLKGMGRGAAETTGLVVGNVGGGLVGTAAAPFTGPAAPVVPAVGRAVGTAAIGYAGREAGEWLFGEPPPWAPQQPKREPLSQAMWDAGTSLGMDALFGGAQWATAGRSAEPAVAERLGQFRKYGIKPTPGQITQTRGPAMLEGAMRYNVVTGGLYDDIITKQTQRLGEEASKVLPAAQGAEAAESMGLIQRGLKRLNNFVFGEADVEFAKVADMIAKDEVIPLTNHKKVWDSIRWKKEYYKTPEEVNPLEVSEAPFEATWQEVLERRSELSKRITEASQVGPAGKGMRGYSSPEARIYIQLRNAIDDDIKALSPEIAEQMTKARAAYAAAKKVYEKKSVIDVLNAIEKDQPGLIIDRYTRPGADASALLSLKKALPKDSFEELIAAKMERVAAPKGVPDPSGVIKWISSLDDRMLQAISTRPGQYEALQELRQLHGYMMNTARMAGNPSQTGQTVANISVVGGLLTMLATSPKLALKAMGIGVAGYGTATVYFRNFILDYLAKGLISKKTAQFLSTTATTALRSGESRSQMTELIKLGYGGGEEYGYPMPGTVP